MVHVTCIISHSAEYVVRLKSLGSQSFPFLTKIPIGLRQGTLMRQCVVSRQGAQTRQASIYSEV